MIVFISLVFMNFFILSFLFFSFLFLVRCFSYILSCTWVRSLVLNEFRLLMKK
jgi:hypothetical protein